MNDDDDGWRIFRLEGAAQPILYNVGEAPGAYRNGTRVMKVAADPGGDLSPNGSVGRVVGSIVPPAEMKMPDGTIMYWVGWDRAPDVPVGVMSWKIRALN